MTRHFRANVLRYTDTMNKDLAWCVITGIWMVEATLDSERIVIIPVLDGSPMHWKCVLVDQECCQNTIFCTSVEKSKPII